MSLMRFKTTPDSDPLPESDHIPRLYFFLRYLNATYSPEGVLWFPAGLHLALPRDGDRTGGHQLQDGLRPARPGTRPGKLLV